MKRRVFAALSAAVLALICLCSICLISCNKDNRQEGKYLLKFKSDGANYDVMIVGGSDGEISLPQDPKKSGYSFAGWYLDDGVWNRPFDPSAELTADTEVYAKWTRTTFAISYKLNGGAYQGAANPSEYSVESDDIVLLPLVREGYAFDGWFLNGNYVEKIKKGTTGNLTLSAKWVKDGYTITYTNVKGVENNNPRTYTVSDAAISLAPLEKVGYTFDGWYCGDTKYTQIPANSTGNFTFEAKWSLVDYSITYLDPEGIVLDVAGFDLPTSYTIESETIVLNSYYLPGYRFEGWVDGDGIRVSTIKKGSYGNIVLYAEMSDDKVFSITFVDVQFGKSNPENPTWYTMGEDSPELKSLEKLDYDFVGWSYGLGDTITEIDTEYGGNITLYAVWKQKEVFKPFEYTVSENDDWCILTGVKDNTATSLVIPDVFDMIAPGALKYCQNLEELSLPYLSAKKGEESNSYLGYLFGASSGMKNNDVLPASLKKVSVKSGTLGEYAFAYCENIEEIDVSAAVSAIGEKAYYQCKNLKTLSTPIYLDGATLGGRGYYTAYYYGIHGSKNGSTYDVLASYGDLTLNVVGGTIGKYAFSTNTSVKHVSVNNVSEIGDYAFAHCGSLESIEADSLQQIGSDAFYDCGTLKEVVLPEGVREIKEDTFKDCSELISVTLPQSIETIANDAFKNCFRLVEVYNLSSLQIEKGSSENGGIGLYTLDVHTSLDSQSKLETANDVLYRKGDKNYVVRYYGSEKNVTVPDGVHVIGRSAFEGRPIEAVTLPETLSEICDYAFYNTSLQTITVPQSVTKIGAYALANNRSLTSVNISDCKITELSHHVFYNTAINSITIPETVTKICANAFEKCDVLSGHVVLSDNIVKIENNVFKGCNSLRKLTLPFIGSELGDSNDFAYIFGEMPRVEELIVTSGEALIENAFENVESLKTVSISKVKVIGAKAFRNCRNLNAVDYSPEIETIGVGAFENTSIGELKLPYLGSAIDDATAKLGYYFGGENSSVPNSLWHVVIGKATLIPNNAFDGCGRLSKIDIPSTVTKIGERAFAGTALSEYVLDEKVVEIGFGAFAGCESMTSITLPFIGDGSIGEDAKTHFGYAFGADTYEDHRRTDGTRAVPPSLKNVTIFGGRICGNAFFRCDRIETLTFGKDVSEISGDAFMFAGNIYSDWYDVGSKFWVRYEQVLQSYSVSADNANFKTIEGVLYTKDGTTLVSYPTAKSGETFTVPDGVTEIGPYAFYAQRNLKTVNVGNDTQKLANYAFAGCGVMTMVEFGTKGALKEIGSYAFSSCTSFKAAEFVIAEGVTTIGVRAFDGTYFDRLVLPSTLESIKQYALQGAAGRVKFNTTCDWDLRNAGGYGYTNREVTADTLEDEEEAARLLCVETHRFYEWIKRETA